MVKMLFIFLFSLNSLAAGVIPIAILDGGFDKDHADISRSFMGGWNFSENNSQIINWKYGNLCDEQCRKWGILFFKSRNLKATPQEIDWLKEMNQKSPETGLRFQQYLLFFHGTAMAYLATQNTTQVGWYGYSVFKDEIYELDYDSLPAVSGQSVYPGDDNILAELRVIENENTQPIEKVSAEIRAKKIRLVSISWGMDQETLALQLNKAVRKNLDFALSDEALEKWSKILFDNYFARAEKLLLENPEVLFFTPTLNRPIDVDASNFKEFPTNVAAQNKIVTQASDGFTKLSHFTGYGKKTVDIAMPGVDALFAVPGNMYFTASGTSATAPYGLNLAARMLEVNPNLTPQGLKKIMIDTANRYEFMKDKNANGAIVNPEAALKAAENFWPLTTTLKPAD